jgi:hydrogenase expression/formation protein HypC
MCLAIPGRVIKIKKENKAVVDFLNKEKEIDISLVDNLKKNDWVIAKQSLAINKIDKKDAKEILNMIQNCDHKH